MRKSSNQIPSEKKELLLSAAEALFAQHGFEGASIRMITERSGVNSAMINYYFGSKDALYVAIFEFRLKQIAIEVREFEETDLQPDIKLEAYLIALANSIQFNRNLHQMLYSQPGVMKHPAVFALVSETRRLVYNFIRTTVHQGIKAGCLREIDEEMFALNVLSLLPSVLTGNTASFVLHNEETHVHSCDAYLSKRVIDYVMSTITLYTGQTNEVSNK